MKIIGLCGGSGSGKGYCAEKIAKYSIPIIDTDVVYHSLINSKCECLDELVSEFGNLILKDETAVDRTILRQIVFSDPERLLPKLNAITHKYVIKETDRLLEEYESQGKRAVLVEVPLMFESGFDKRCDYVICVVADRDLRIKRTMERDQISHEYAKKRIDSQMSDGVLLERSDFAIVNDGNEILLDTQIDDIMKKIFNAGEDD